jgi:hypothetical protein
MNPFKAALTFNSYLRTASKRHIGPPRTLGWRFYFQDIEVAVKTYQEAISKFNLFPELSTASPIIPANLPKDAEYRLIFSNSPANRRRAWRRWGTKIKEAQDAKDFEESIVVPGMIVGREKYEIAPTFQAASTEVSNGDENGPSA